MILATLINCNKCEKVVMLRTQAEWDEFELTWFDGCFAQFCPDCKESPECLETQSEEDETIRHYAKLAEMPRVN